MMKLIMAVLVCALLVTGCSTNKNMTETIDDMQKGCSNELGMELHISSYVGVYKVVIKCDTLTQKETK